MQKDAESAAGLNQPVVKRAQNRGIDALLRWRLYPGLPHLFFYVFTGVLVYFAFAPGQRGEGNLATELVWKLWWPLLPFVMLMGGRVWCGVCPFGGAADAASKLRKDRPAAPKAMRAIGPWLGIGSVFLFGLSFLALGLEMNAGATGFILIGMTVAAFGLSLAWRGRSFCRYLCPVGMITRVYSFFAWLRPRGSGINAATGKSCPVGQSPASLRQPSQCQLCGECNTSSGTGGITTSFNTGSPRLPGSKEFGHPEAALSLMLLGLMAADSVRMTSVFARFQQTMLPTFGYNYRLSVIVGVTGLVTAVIGVVLAAALVAGRGRLSKAFSGIGFTLLPLTLGVFLSLAAQHLWSGGWPSLQTMLVEFRLIDWSGHMPPTNVYFFSWPLKLIQVGLLGAGLMLSLWLAGKKLTGVSKVDAGAIEDATAAADGRTVLIRRGLVVLASGGFGILFILPMSGAC